MEQPACYSDNLAVPQVHGASVYISGGPVGREMPGGPTPGTVEKEIPPDAVQVALLPCRGRSSGHPRHAASDDDVPRRVAR